MVDLERELGYEDVARLLELKADQKKLLLDAIEILEHGGPEAEKLEEDISFIKKMILK